MATNAPKHAHATPKHVHACLYYNYHLYTFFRNGTTKEECDLKLGSGFKATLKFESPTVDDII